MPENRRRPDSRRIRLSYVRFPSTGPTSGPPIVYLAGGPGGSGIGTAQERRFPLFMALREVADVIAFDQRGTGLSNHIPPCKAEESFPSDRPGRHRELLAAVVQVGDVRLAIGRLELRVMTGFLMSNPFPFSFLSTVW